MPTLSKMHEKCEKCKSKDNCNNKRMVACAMAEGPKLSIDIKVSPTLSSEALLNNTSIQANIAEQLKKNLYKNMLGYNCL